MTDVWDLPYRHSAGRDGSHFLRHLRDEGAIIAKHCPLCRRRSVPPCPCPPTDATAWHKAGPEGSIVVAVPVGDAPGWALAVVRLEGADSAVVQRVRTTHGSASALTPGTKLSAAFAAKRQGRITDFWFEIDDLQSPSSKRGRTR